MDLRKARAWTFTVNNYTDDDLDNILSHFDRYLIFGFEVCPTTGTEHIQGYVFHQNPVRFSAMKKWLPTAHFEIAQGSPEQNRDYCSKESQWYEFGDCPIKGLATFDKIEQAMKNPRENFHLFHQYRKAYSAYANSVVADKYRSLRACSETSVYALARYYRDDEQQSICMYPSDYDGESVYFVYAYWPPNWIEHWANNFPIKERVGYEFRYQDPDIIYLVFRDVKEERHIRKKYHLLLDAINEDPTEKGLERPSKGSN